MVDRLETRPVGTFGPAFVASLVTILREGVEVILVVAMLLALVAKAAAGSWRASHDEANALAQSDQSIWPHARSGGASGWPHWPASSLRSLLNVVVISARGRPARFSKAW